MGLIIWMFWLIILNKVNSQAGSECRTCSGVSSLWCYYFYFHRCGFVLLLCFLLFTAAFICFLLCVFIFSSRVNPVSWAQRKYMSKLLPTRPKPLNLREAPQPAIMKTSLRLCQDERVELGVNSPLSSPRLCSLCIFSQGHQWRACPGHKDVDIVPMSSTCSRDSLLPVCWSAAQQEWCRTFYL